MLTSIFGVPSGRMFRSALSSVRYAAQPRFSVPLELSTPSITV